MSQENVELIRSLQPGPEVDIAELFRDDKMAEAAWAAVSSVVHDDLESSIVSQGVRSTYRGFDGLRAAWVDWLAPWDSYYAVMGAQQLETYSGSETQRLVDFSGYSGPWEVSPSVNVGRNR